MTPPASRPNLPLGTLAREWARLGITGFGGPPAHIRLLGQLCVQRTGWIDAAEFEDAIAACSLLPGPASAQLSIYCARRVGGTRGAIVGGVGFILPRSGDHPDSGGALSGAAPLPLGARRRSGRRSRRPGRRDRGRTVTGARLRARAREAGAPGWWVAAVAAGAIAPGLAAAWVALVLVGCGLLSLVRLHPPRNRVGALWLAGTGATAAGAGTFVALAWTALKVGLLSWGGGFVIIPHVRADAVGHHWLTSTEFLGAVAIGQVTPGPVVQTVAVVGYGAAGLVGGIAASVVAFAPPFVFILAGGRHFDRLRTNARAQAFLAGAGPAAIGAILGAAVPLALALRVAPGRS